MRISSLGSVERVQRRLLQEWNSGVYSEFVREAHDAAKKVDPAARIGMSVANFDVRFLDAAIKVGAADHFDYICIHPYESLGALAAGEKAASSRWPRRCARSVVVTAACIPSRSVTL
jgi:hypothetical protein